LVRKFGKFCRESYVQKFFGVKGDLCGHEIDERLMLTGTMHYAGEAVKTEEAMSDV
jgi:hypothetical protein